MKNWLLAKKRFDGCLFSLALLCTSTLVAASVYKTTDEQGRVTYSDTPSSDQPATEAQLRPINQINTAVSPVKDGAVTESVALSGYSSIAIVAPEADTVISYEQGNIIVQLALTPELQRGHVVQFYLDGKPYRRPVAATSYAVTKPERGTHTVSASVVAADGAVIASSAPVTVHVQRHFKRKK